MRPVKRPKVGKRSSDLNYEPRYVEMKFLVIALVMLATAPTFGQQQRSIKRKVNLRIVRDKPSVFISFDHYGRREPLRVAESSEGVWLRLHNNTRATIFLPSYGVPKEVGQVGLFYEPTHYVYFYSSSLMR